MSQKHIRIFFIVRKGFHKKNIILKLLQLSTIAPYRQYRRKSSPRETPSAKAVRISIGITGILIITGRNKRAIKNHFNRSFKLESNFNNDRISQFF
jgi:hypothetical protein